MKFILPLLFFISTTLHGKVEIQEYKKHSWDNSWNESISKELDQHLEKVMMSGQIDADDLKQLDCPGYNKVTDNNLKADFWIAFFSALTRAESAFNTKARSKHGNLGLLQFAKATARSQCGLSAEEIVEPDKHLRCGVRLMSWQLEGAPAANGKQRRPDLRGQLFGKHILLWGPLRQNDKGGRALLVGWFKKHLDQLPFCKDS